MERELNKIRREIAERLEAKGLCLEWNASADTQPLPQPQLHALRSILRETVSNASKHSSSTMFRIKLTAQGGTLDILVEDDGVGFVPDPAHVHQVDGLLLICDWLILAGGSPHGVYSEQ